MFIFQGILAQRNWSGAHHFEKEQPCSCTNVSVSQSNFVSVGEDGRINVFQVEQVNPLRVLGKILYYESFLLSAWLINNRKLPLGPGQTIRFFHSIFFLQIPSQSLA